MTPIKVRIVCDHCGDECEVVGVEHEEYPWHKREGDPFDTLVTEYRVKCSCAEAIRVLEMDADERHNDGAIDALRYAHDQGWSAADLLAAAERLESGGDLAPEEVTP